MDENRKQLTLWYTNPASGWTEALPLGNGHTGAMVYGGVRLEKLGLTENTCYSGEASDRNDQKGAAFLPEIRKALFEHDYKKANSLAENIIGRKLNYGTNLPFADLLLEMKGQDEEVRNYTRGLDLERAVAFVRYSAGEKSFFREVFVSNPHKVLVMKISCSVPAGLDFDARLEDAGNPSVVTVEENGDLLLNGHAFETNHSDGKTGVALHGCLRIETAGGTRAAGESSLSVRGADSALILLALDTDFDGNDPADSCSRRVAEAGNIPYEALLAEHAREYGELFGRVSLELGCGTAERIPTDERLKTVKGGGEDPQLTALMFQYGRYLLISSSRPDSRLPAHLQGIWNDNIACRMGWTCDMHLDINTEMNYWPSEVTNLPECSVPLFDWIERRLMPSGKLTAKKTYGMDGWAAHVVSNAWGYSAPGWATSRGIHPTGGLWAATHLWEHYLFTEDREFLRSRLYPVYREAVRFFVQYLVQDPETGWYLSGPSMSPENSFMYDWNNPVSSSLSMGTVCDTVMIRELFGSFIHTCETLGLEDELLEKAGAMLEKLPPFQVGKNGQLQEWFYDYDEPDAHHRHTSHLLSVYPFSQIRPEKAPELAKAALVSIRKRTTPDWRWEDTGWARALLILYCARLLEAGEAYRHILAFQRGLTNINLLSFCPPGAGADTDVFEMDGTTGFCSGVAEMLLQSVDGVIDVLPALPDKWDAGTVKGLRARGGFEVGITWKEHEPVEIEIVSLLGGACTVRVKGKKADLRFRAGEKRVLELKDLH